MRTTADPADLVTLDAELLAGATMTARTRCGIAAGLATVLVLEGADPTWRMRARSIWFRRRQTSSFQKTDNTLPILPSKIGCAPTLTKRSKRSQEPG